MMAKALLIILFCGIATGSYLYEEIEEKHSQPQPYRYGYQVKDKEGTQSRHEESDGHGTVKGSYGYTDDKGLYREVHYVADKHGFRATVKTNEPGTANQDPAHVKVEADPQYSHQYEHSAHFEPHQQNIELHEEIPQVQKVILPIRIHHTGEYRQPLSSLNYSPFSGFSYNSPLKGYNYRSVIKEDNYPHVSEEQESGYNFHVPHYRNNYGLNAYSDENEDFSRFGLGDLEKHKDILEELKSLNNQQKDSLMKELSISKEKLYENLENIKSRRSHKQYNHLKDLLSREHLDDEHNDFFL
ncbi:Cuticle protein 16.8, partial [Stegodyphus mimosarum]